MNWNPQSKQRAEDLRKLAAGESSSNTPHTEAAGGTGDNASSALPPTAPIALPVRAEDAFLSTGDWLAWILDAKGTVILKAKSDTQEKADAKARYIVHALNSTATLSRELEEAKGKTGYTSDYWFEQYEGQRKGRIEDVTRLSAELEEAKAERDGLKQQIGWHEEANADHRRWVRHLDVLWNGEAGAAKQAALIDVVAQIERELTALRAAPRSETEGRDKERWKPIETAPRPEIPGKIVSHRILAYHDSWDMAVIVKWSPQRPAPHWTTDAGAVLNVEPTHWMPLPERPALAHYEKGAGE